MKLISGTLIAFLFLFFIQLENYLLFHVAAELFSIVIAYSLFTIVWNGRSYLKDRYLLLLGIAYFFVGLIDLLHTIGYKGMNIFQDYDYYANQFWTAGRGLESLTLLLGTFLIGRKKELSVRLVFIVYSFISAVLIYTILFSDIFPECFVEGQGQTTFKVVSEYVINVILILTILSLVRKRSYFAADIFRYLIISIVFTIISELAFTFYVSNYGLSNMIGHYAKIVSFYFIYRAVVRKNIIEPYDSIFRELNLQKEKLSEANSLKNKLFSVISHDLRGPLTGIMGVTDSLVQDFDSCPEKDKKMILNEVNHSVKNLYSMLDNLLSWAKLEIEEHKLRPQRIDVNQFASEVIDINRPVFRIKRINLELKADEDFEKNIDADPDTLKVVFNNILTNAMKFSHPETTVRLILSGDDKRCIISIIDQGEGMDFKPEMLTSEVNESRRGTLNEHGSGLGLFMIYKYTVENGGSLKIDSTPGRGTSVILEFPAV